jgi:signal peptidase II
MLYLLFAAAVAAGDQLLKKWIVAQLELFEEVSLLPGIVQLTHIRNTGAAFSMLESMRWLLVFVSAAASVAIIIYIFRSRIGVIGKLSAAGVLGGAVGNLIDRASLGYVVDMFELEFMEFAVFNVADCFITVGGIVFVVCYIVCSVREERELKALNNLRSEEKYGEEKNDKDV